MVPLRLNLLSEEKRRFHERNIYVQFIKNVLEVLLIIVCISSILVLFGKSWLQNKLQDVSSQTIVSDSKFLHTNQSVDRANKAVQKIDKIQSSYILWTPILTEFANTIPGSVVLTSMTMDVTNRTIALTGVAKQRDDLLLLKDQLEKLTWVFPVTIPVDQLTNKDNVNFNFSVKIKE